MCDIFCILQVPKPLKVIQTGANLMSNRFQPYEEIQTEAVLRYQVHFILKTSKTIHQQLATIGLASTQQTKATNKQTMEFKTQNHHYKNASCSLDDDITMLTKDELEFGFQVTFSGPS